MVKLNGHIPTELKIIMALIGISCLVAFGDRKHNKTVCQMVVVELKNTYENHFIDEQDILKIVENDGQNIAGKPFHKIDLRALEKKLIANQYISDAQLYGDVKGRLIAEIILRKPVSRLINTGGKDAYIAQDGSVMQMSDVFSSRTLLISGSIIKKLTHLENIYQMEQGKQIMDMIRYINEDQFWRAQIAQLDFNDKGEVKIYPQLTGQIIEFGEPIDIDLKFTKIMIFYKEILPQMGWNKYHRINVAYKGQIVAE